MNKLLKFRFLKALMLITLTVSGNSMAYDDDTPNIEVKGQASILAEPDHFSLSIAIVERGRLTDKIRSVVDHKSNQVIQVATSLGIKSHDINSARVSLRVIEDKPSITVDGVEVIQRRSNGPNNQHTKVYAGVNSANNQSNVKPQYFELSRSININFSDIKLYDQFLNQVIKLGVNHISPLSMSVANTEKHYQQALVQAINNAKEKATQIAKHSNVKLGKLLFVKEQSSNYYRSRVNSVMMSAESAPSHNSQVGNQVINASVLVKFSILD